MAIYSLKYNFNYYNSDISSYLNDVYRNSLILYKKTYSGNSSTGTEDIDLIAIKKSIGYLEDYLYYFYYKYNGIFNYIFSILKKNVKKIGVFDPSMRGVYGQFVPNYEALYINPELNGSRYLTSDERTRLYVCHELGHAVHHEWIKTINSDGKIDNDTVLNYSTAGFDLLDEATAQNQAEDIAYFYAGKDRPKQMMYSGSLFSGKPYKTNFDYYGNLQGPATYFARTLRGIGKYDSDDDALDLLSFRTLDGNFVNSIIGEYRNDNHLQDLYFILSYLGIIKKASYATFGFDDPLYIKKSINALNELKMYTERLRNYNEPIVNRF